MFENFFFLNSPENLSFIKIWQEQRVLYMKTNIHFWSYLAQFFLEWETFETNLQKKKKKNKNKKSKRIFYIQ